MIRNLLLITLRGKGFPIYTPFGSGSYNLETTRYELYINTGFNAHGNEGDRKNQFILLQSIIHQMLDGIKKGVIDENVFNQAVKEVRSKYSGAYFSNSNCQKRLFEYYKYNVSWLCQNEVEAFLDSLSLKNVSIAAKQYLDERNRYEFKMGE